MFREISRNKKQILENEECRQILEKCTSGVLNLLGDDDYPYGVPLSYTLSGDKIYFHCAKKGHKIDAIRKHDKVSFTVIETDKIVPETYTTHYRSVIVFGKAKLIEDENQQREILTKLAAKYSADFMDGVPAEINKSIKAVQIIELDIKHISGKEAIEFAKAREK